MVLNDRITNLVREMIDRDAALAEFDPLADPPCEERHPTVKVEVSVSQTPFVRPYKSFSFKVTSKPRVQTPHSDYCVHKGRFSITRTSNCHDIEVYSSPSDEEIRMLRCEAGIHEPKKDDFDDLIDIL